jgi:hypothetical protein
LRQARESPGQVVFWERRFGVDLYGVCTAVVAAKSRWRPNARDFAGCELFVKQIHHAFPQLWIDEERKKQG